MEQSKLYEALMDFFEYENKWFGEEVYIEECYADEELQDELDDCYYHGQQIDFADKHWNKISKSLANSQWETNYLALLELRAFFPKRKKIIKRKKKN